MMYPTIKTLTAVAALSLAAGGALAQTTVQVPLGQPAADATVPAPDSGTTHVVNPDGSREAVSAPAAEAAPAEEAPAPEAEDATPDAEAAQQADAQEAEAEADAPAAEPAADEAPSAEDAAAAATDANAEIAADGGDHGSSGGSHDSHIIDVSFSFEGPFGKYDQMQLQRGLQVYTEVCAACHGLQYVPLRTLGDATGPGIPEDQVRAYAANFTKIDPDTGDEVPREPTDHFPTIPHQDGMGPDLSLMAKARAGFHGPYGTGISQFFNGIGGPEYIYSILVSYTGETKTEAGATLYENTAFPGGWIAMPPPMQPEGGSVEFQDGHPNDLHSEAKEVAAFLMWTAEPKMMQRKQVGFVSVLFLIVLSSLLYLTNKRLWSPIKHPRKDA